MKKRIVTFALIIALLAICLGGTMAYLQDTSAAKNTMTVGSVKIEQIEKERNEDGELVDFTQNKPVVPAVGDPKWADENIVVGGGVQKVFDVKNVIDKFVYVKNTGKSDAYVRTILVLEAPGYDPNDLIHVNVNDDGLTMTPWAPVDINGIQYVYTVFTYTDEVEPGEDTKVSLAQLYLDPKVTNDDLVAYGDTWDVLCLSQAVQADGFSDAATALDTAFGAVNADKVVEWLG